MPSRGNLTIGDTGESGVSSGRLAAYAGVALLLQIILAPNMSIGGISPNFLILALIPMAVYGSRTSATLWGFVLGLLFDLLGSGPVGVMALVMAVTGYAVSVASSSAMDISNIVSWIIVAAVTCVLANLAFCIVVSILGYEADFLGSIVFRVIPWTLYNIVIALIEWPVLKRVFDVGGGAGYMPASRIKF